MNSRSITERIQTPAADGRSLAVEFIRREDRFGHEVQIIDGTAVRPLLLSLEGSSTDEWPSSPVLQQLHIERRAMDRDSKPGHDLPANDVALLVGMAGRSHWSLSVEADAASPALIFDVACRVQTDKIPDLRSTYQLLTPVRSVTDERCTLAVDQTRSVAVGADTQLTRLRQGESSLCLVPQHGHSTTRRWKYRIELM